VPYPEPRDAVATKVGKGNRRTDTRPEVALRSALHRRGMRFRKDHPIRIEGRRPVRPDVVFIRACVAVFVDGCFWHGCPEHQVVPKANPDYWIPKLRRNVERDREVDAALRDAGWTVLRYWEHHDPAEVAARVEQVIRARQSGAVR
jgi:DNA mismatch endonuclease (patch repair protein)